MISDGKIVELYLSWVNEFLTLEAFCEYYGFKEEIARSIIKKGKELCS